MALKKDIIVKNYTTYKGGLTRLIGEERSEEIIAALGGDDAVMNGTFANLDESGAAFDGSFTKNVIKLVKYANDLNHILPEELRADSSSINKVCMLSHISKILLYSPNDNNWEVVNRGMVYKYNPLDGALRVGERSALIAMNAGVKFTEFEFEAMRIMDKSSDDDGYTKYFSSPLSTVVRQANELLTLENKARWKIVNTK